MQIQSQNLLKDSATLQRYDYQYGQLDAAGNVDASKNNGQLARIDGYIGTGKQWSQKFNYDELGRLAEAREYKQGDDAQLTYRQKFDFDRFGNMYRKAANNQPAGQQNPLPYTPIEDADINKATNRFTTGTTYDEAGQVVTDGKFRQMSFGYDANGRMVRAQASGAADAAEAGRAEATLSDSGAFVGAGQAGANWSEAFVYDSRSNLSQKTDARGVRTLFSYQISGGGYDPLNRIQSRSYDLSGPLEPNLPISAAPAVTYSYMTSGDKERISQIRTAGLLTEDYQYDVEGRVSEYKQTVDYRANYPMTVNYLYDTLDRVKEVTYPAQYGLSGSPRKIVANAYDTASRLTQMTYGTVSNSVQQAGDIVYNASDQTTSINVGAAGTNQVSEQYTFDPQTGLLTNQKAVRNGATLLDLSYDYNRNNSVGSLSGRTGNLTRVIDNLNNNKNREYEFDVLGRLTKMKGGPTGNLSSQTYTYDRYGNRTSVAASGVAADNTTMPADGIPNLSFDNTSNRITTAGFQYDVAGNQIRALAEDGTTWVKYEYDAANRIQAVKKDDTNQTLLQAFQYGATNARLIDYDPSAGVNRFYAAVGGTVLSEYTEYQSLVFTWTKSYTYLGDSQLATVTPNGAGGETVEYNHPDRLGTRIITNQQTGSVSEQTHLPFGKALDAESTVTNNNKRFTSYERSAPTGLDYAINRTYDSKQGRFTQVDPIGMGSVSLSAPQTLNLYAYCANDPINRTDPSGLGFFSFLKKLFKWIMIAVTVAVAILSVVGAILTPVAMAAFMKTMLGQILGFIANIPGMIGGNLFSGAGASIARALGFTERALSIATSVINSLLGWGALAAAKAAVGAIANSFDDKRRRGEKSARAKQMGQCDYYGMLLSRFSDLFDKLSKLTKTDDLEHGAAFGEVTTGEVIAGYGEPASSEIYSGTKGVTRSAMGEDFTIWLGRKKSELGGRQSVMSVHTHPRNTAKPSGASSPGPKGDWGYGDLGVANLLKMTGVIITDTKLVVYDGSKTLCTLNR